MGVFWRRQSSVSLFFVHAFSPCVWCYILVYLSWSGVAVPGLRAFPGSHLFVPSNGPAFLCWSKLGSTLSLWSAGLYGWLLGLRAAISRSRATLQRGYNKLFILFAICMACFPWSAPFCFAMRCLGVMPGQCAAHGCLAPAFASGLDAAPGAGWWARPSPALRARQATLKSRGVAQLGAWRCGMVRRSVFV